MKINNENKFYMELDLFCVIIG